MARYGDFYENKVTGERGVVLRGDEDSGDRPALVHLVVQPHGAVLALAGLAPPDQDDVNGARP